MKPNPASPLPAAGWLESLRRFWPWFVPFWVLPVPTLLLSALYGFPLAGAISIPVLGFLAAIPLLRGQMRLSAAYILFSGVTLLVWGLVYGSALFLFGRS